MQSLAHMNGMENGLDAKTQMMDGVAACRAVLAKHLTMDGFGAHGCLVTWGSCKTRASRHGVKAKAGK